VFKLRFAVAGAHEVLRTFSRWTEGVEDLGPAFETITEDFYQISADQFESEGRYGSGGWVALSPRYAAWKAKAYPGAKVLEREGWLKGALTGQNDYRIREIGKHELQMGANLPYGLYHQTGTRRMPARPPIQLTEVDKTRWAKIVHKYLFEVAKAVAVQERAAEDELRQHMGGVW
jgi:phage gpG-like protein